jgi:hypothetical protein
MMQIDQNDIEEGFPGDSADLLRQIIDQEIIEAIRKTYVEQIASELVSIQPIHEQQPELFKEYCAFINSIERKINHEGN